MIPTKCFLQRNDFYNMIPIKLTEMICDLVRKQANQTFPDSSADKTLRFYGSAH